MKASLLLAVVLTLVANTQAAWPADQLIAAAASGTIAKGADVEAKDEYGWTPLHRASINGDVAAMEALIAKGADVEAKEGMGRTPLHMATHRASINGDVAAMEALIAKGADVDAKDEDGRTPLHWASINGDVAVIEALIAKGADSINGDVAAIELLLAKGADIDTKDKYGDTPRDAAAFAGCDAVVEALDKALANPQAPGDRADEEGGQEDVHFSSALDAQREVAGWLRGLLPKLGKADAVRYQNHLIENGFDSTEAMALLEQGDLGFMLEGHKRLVAKQLIESQDH